MPDVMQWSLMCGASVEIEKAEFGFYITIEQANGTSWFNTEEPGIARARISSFKPLADFGHSYFKGYLSDRADLAQIFRDIADFIERERG